MRLLGLEELENELADERLHYDNQESSSEVPEHTAAERLAWQVQTQYLTKVRLSTYGKLAVVGESYCQGALKTAARGRVSKNGYHDSIPTQALLVPDPQNPYDGNAVRVEIEGRTVGHLAREVAVHYQPPLLELLTKSQVGYCPARVTGGGQGRFYGIYLHVASPELLIPANPSEGLSVIEPEIAVTVTKEKQHQEALSAFAPTGDSETTPVVAELHPPTLVNESKGGEVGVSLPGGIVGYLTPYQSERYAPILQPVVMAGKRPSAEGYVYWKRSSLEIELLLPRLGRASD